MCVSLAVMTAAAMGMQVFGALKQGQDEKAMASYNEDVANANAVAARQKATFDENMLRERIGKTLSAQRASYAKSGVAIEGSPLLTLQDTASSGELDALAIRYGGNIAASRFESEAKMAGYAGEVARSKSYFQAGSSLLSGGAEISKQKRWDDYFKK